jgi:mono/diheme cytochrome c family protein
VFVAVLVATRLATHGLAQGEAPKIDAGIYTAGQAERGKQVFQNTCTTCHNYDLTGNSGRGPALAGDEFLANWEAASPGVLFAKMKNTMPRNNPASLTEDVYLDLMAYILQVNKFPAGANDLKAAVLDQVTLPGKGGASVANFALVEVVGCLTRSNDRWMLTSTSAPVSTNDQPSSSEELQQAASKPLGGETFRLMSAGGFNPDAHAGHKVQAKGILARATNDNRLNVTSLATVAQGCVQ